ncbi:HOOK protein-domain-containing protein [Peziza echinospora]|nr:HOOK protein-domain-containing protein [Peziza echinospora]
MRLYFYFGVDVIVDIDSYYFRATGQGQDSSPDGHWVLRFHKLKRIHKDLTRYYTDSLGHRLPSTPPNLTLIAKDSARDDTIRLVKIIVAAAVQSERREEYIRRIQGLSPRSQTELMLVINQMIELDDSEEDSSFDKSMEIDDNEFRMEEEMARLAAEKEAIEAEKKMISRKYERLLHDYDENQRELERLKDQVGDDEGMSGDGFARADAVLRSQIDQLQSDVQRLEDIIVDKEALIAEQGSSIASFTRKVDELLPQAEKAMKWKDDLDEANHLVENLRKGQNVAEKYRKKLEGMGELERQVKSLEQQNTQLIQSLRQSEEVSKQAQGLRKLVDTYKKQVDKMDNDHAELLRAKQRMEIEFNTMKEKAAGAETQKIRDMEQIQILEERVRELESGVMSKVVEEVSGDLNSELTFTTKTKADLKLQISKLEAEIARLKEGGATSADNMLLKSLLDDATKAKEKLENDYLEAHTERLILESQLASLSGGGPIEGYAKGPSIIIIFHHLCGGVVQLADSLTELSATKKRLSEVTAELTTTKRDLVIVKSDLRLVGKDKLEALAELKDMNSTELIELREEHSVLERRLREAESELDQKKTQLNTVLLEKDELSKKKSDHQDAMLDRVKDIAELKATIAALEGSSEGRDAALEKRVVQLQNKLEDQREKMTKSREHIKKQNAIIKDLKEQIENGAGMDDKARDEAIYLQKKKRQEELSALQRENKLMTSAWYDLSSRLQTNTVVLLRRSEPQSWLNKQRNAIHVPIKR